MSFFPVLLLVSILTITKRGKKMKNLETKIEDVNYLRCDIHIPNVGVIELNENYEDDKYHLVFFDIHNDHIETVGVNTEIEVLNFLRSKQRSLFFGDKNNG